MGECGRNVKVPDGFVVVDLFFCFWQGGRILSKWHVADVFLLTDLDVFGGDQCMSMLKCCMHLSIG